jgi:hypothetical protein
MDIRDLPFDMAHSKDEVMEMLNRGKDYDDTKIRSELCAYDTAENPAKLCQLFRGDEEGLVLEEHPKNDKKKVIFYTDCCREGKETQLLHQFSDQIDKEHYDFWVGCDSEKTKKHVDSAYPMLHDSQNISSEDDIRLSSVGAPVKELYLKGKIDFEKAMKYLIHEYGLIPVQQYGYSHFDTFVIYDTVDPEMIISMALMDAGSKVLFITKDMLKEVENGNVFMKDAVRFAADYCRVIAVTDAEDKDAAERVLGADWTGKVSVASDVTGLNLLIR